jgi:hypothetical protein
MHADNTKAKLKIRSWICIVGVYRRLSAASTSQRNDIRLCWTKMTKVQIDFRLQHALDDELMTRLAGAYSIYGIQKIRLAPSEESLTVEYDATRLRPAEVHAALTRAGIPVAIK